MNKLTNYIMLHQQEKIVLKVTTAHLNFFTVRKPVYRCLSRYDK